MPASKFDVMNFLDFLLLIPIAWFAYKGFSKGLIMEIFSVAAVILGIYACFQFTDWVSAWLKETFEESWATLTLFVYLVTFAGAFALVYFSGKLIETLFKQGSLGMGNKLAGGFFGVIKSALLISGLLLVLNKVNSEKELISKETAEGSFLYKPLSNFNALILPAFRDTDWAFFFDEAGEKD